MRKIIQKLAEKVAKLNNKTGLSGLCSEYKGCLHLSFIISDTWNSHLVIPDFWRNELKTSSSMA